MRPSRRENAKIPSQAGVVSPLDEYLATETMGVAADASFQRRVALARGRRSRRGRMFGRFGGGGNFVAQYRCYPVSFIDRVRLPLQSAEPFQTRARRPQPPARARAPAPRIRTARASR